MKNTRRILAVILSLVMGITMFAIGASAAPGGTITINQTSSSVSIDGKTFNAYKIFDVTTDGNDAYAYTYANQDVADYFAAKTPSITVAADAVAYIEALGAEEFAKELYVAITDNTPLTDLYGLSTAATAVGSGTSAVFTGLDMGYFFIYDADSGVAVTKAACVLTTNDDDVEIDLKSDLPTIEKTITNGVNGSDEATFADANDVIDFQLETAVPDMTGYDKYFFIIKDTLTNLTLDTDWEDDLVITIDGVVIPATAYTVTVTGGDFVKIVFENFIQYKAQAGDAIIVTFSASYTPAGNEETAINNVYITYSNDPLFDYQGTDEPEPGDPTDDSPEDEVKVYSLSIDLTKVDGDDNLVLLDGAEFALYKDEGSGFVLVDTLTSDANGEISFGELGTGVYRLIETVAPNGYNILLDPIDFTISATFTGTEIATLTVNNALFTADDDAQTVSATVENNAGSILPDTGGIGVNIFYITGITLMIGAAIFFIYRKKKVEAN